MKLFIDSAIIKEIEWARDRGLLDGVSTDPTLLSNADRKLADVVRDILNLVKDKPVAIEAVSQNADDIIEEANGISKLAKNIVVKIPVTDDGLRAIRQLARKGVQTNATLVCTASQALLAARSGATYVSIFVGRLDETKEDGIQVVRDTVEVFRKYEYPASVVVSSVRNPEHVIEGALAGADAAAVPFKVLVQMVRHDLTDKGIQKFLADWEKVPK
ncbi:MAG: transaldolase family protein [Patescibacteria group bacterium]|nr:transaldolase family protein [Patescibacteria group bacterium]